MKALCFLFVVTTLLCSCSGQQPATEVKTVQPDTMNLPLPKPYKGDTASAKDYKHSIQITPTGYTVTMSGRKYPLSGDDELASFLESNSTQVNKDKLSIIVSPEVSYEKLVTMLDLIRQQKIEKYKVISANDGLHQSPK